MPSHNDQLQPRGRMLVAVLLCISFSISHANAMADACKVGHGLSAEQLQQIDFDDARKQPATGLGGTFALKEVAFIRQNVFPDRHHWLARQANRFNSVTKRRALRDAFPVDIGASINENQRQEAERILREKPYLYDAVVLVRETCAAEVSLDVVVRDVWTLTPGIGVSRSGGDNETSVSLADVNIMGTGKSISVEYFDDRDRAGTFFGYFDPNLRGSRWTMDAVAADNDDGERYGLALVRPFYALDTAYSFGVGADHFVREEDLEFLSKDVFELDAETDEANIFMARSSGRRDGWVSRYYLGARYIKETFDFPTDFPGAAKTSRRFSYPYVAWELLEDRYVESTDVERVGITEDLKLGWSSYAELGWSTDAFGGDGDYLLARGAAAYRKYVKQRHLLSVDASFRGRYDLDSNRTEDVLFVAEASYLWRQTKKLSFLTSANYTHTRNLPLDKQLTLGGDSGLRGYPTRYQNGDRSFLITLEQRYYSNAYPFGLLRVGYAGFIDVGRAWFDDHAPEWVPHRDGDHFGTLANVGVGLRLESVRTRRDRVLHIDIAKPLVDGPFVDTWEVTLSGKQRF